MLWRIAGSIGGRRAAGGGGATRGGCRRPLGRYCSNRWSSQISSHGGGNAHNASTCDHGALSAVAKLEQIEEGAFTLWVHRVELLETYIVKN